MHVIYLFSKEDPMAEMQFDFKGNYLNFLNHKATTLIPNSFVGNKVM